ncbi:hypothetical protein FNF29_00169 [Cafeteria roenbergensis]|uniref:CCAAT-binding factor domain-containing protein n=1 Tax=Cafeteria roenbergensis TaxID=33653 RepID=A0A5A8CWN7_CAFRO|nr:hypothetical protein FNF29_00169 [Cafeteria roenbergensis]|eukprot:KAA0157593.1 hypothetical protein FNF29_00169 [Cafeteria roenbergensis]
MADRPAACPDDVLTALLGDVLVAYPDARQCTLAAVVRIATAARSQAARRAMDDEGWSEALANAGPAVVAERLARVLMGVELPASEGEAAAERTLVRHARSGGLPGLPGAARGGGDDDDASDDDSDASDDDSDSDDSDSGHQAAASGSAGAGRSTSAPPLSEQRRAFEDAWMATLRLDMPRRALLAVLTALPSEKVLSHFDRPLRLADFFTKAYDGGAGTGANEAAMLALRGIFLLTTRHGLDYPGFYARLYALVTPAALSSPFRPRFLRLLALFLGSPALAANLAAAFAKRLARAALASPTPAAIFAVPAIYNILKAHPSLATMIHRGDLIRAGPKAAAVAVMEAARGVGMDSSAQAAAAAAEEAAATAAAAAADPYDPSAADPAASFASASQLWELVALRRHWHSSVAQRCGMFERSLDRPPMDLDASAALTFAELAATESRRRAAAARTAAAAAAAAAAKEAPSRTRPGKRPRGHHPLSDPSGTTLADVKPVSAALLRVPGAAVTLDSLPANSALDTLGRAAPSEVGSRALLAAAASTPPKGGEASKHAVALVQLGAVAAVRGAGLDLLALLEVAARGQDGDATAEPAPAAGAGAGQTAQDYALAEGPTVDMDRARAWVPRSMDDEDEEEAAAAAAASGGGADGGRGGKRPRRDPSAGPVAGWTQTFGFDAGAAGAAMARTSDVGARFSRRKLGIVAPMAAESENTRAYLGAIASSFGAGEIHEAVERTASRESGLLSLLAYKAMSFQACAHSGCSMMVSAQDDIYCPTHQKLYVLDAWHAAAPERETGRPAEDAPRLANNDFPGEGTEPSFASCGDSPAFMRRALSDMAHPHGASHAAERARASEQSKPVVTSGPTRVEMAMATQRVVNPALPAGRGAGRGRGRGRGRG